MKWKCVQNGDDYITISDELMFGQRFETMVSIREDDSYCQAAMSIDSLIEIRNHLTNLLEGLE